MNWSVPQFLCLPGISSVCERSSVAMAETSIPGLSIVLRGTHRSNQGQFLPRNIIGHLIAWCREFLLVSSFDSELHVCPSDMTLAPSCLASK